MNSIEMSDEQNESGAANKNEITLANKSVALEFFAEAFEELFLRRAEKIFQSIHAGTSSALQL